MQFSTYFLLAVIYSVISIFGMGIALTSWLDRVRQEDAALIRPTLLLSSCIGLYWTTLVFVVLFMARIPLSSSTTKRMLLINCGLIALGIVTNRHQMRSLAESIARDGVTLAVGCGGALLGVWAMLRFPHVLDSGQIIWTQEVLNGNLRLPVSAMMGFSALVGMFGALFPASPVVTTAAAFKPLLLGLYGCLAVYLGSILAPRHRLVLALGFLALSILSTFGTYGLLELGKDSMWGILFAMTFLGTLCRADAGRRGVELAFYFTMAAILGVIALPYMVIAYALWLVFSAPKDGAADTLPTMMIVSAPLLPTVLAGFLSISPSLVYVAYVILTITVMIGHRTGLIGKMQAFLSRLARPARSITPLVFALAAFLLFPVALAFPVWFNADGSVVTDTRAPLDGITSFLDYMLCYPAQNVTVGFGLAASLVIGFTAYGRRNPGLLALAAMPLVVLTLALIRAHLPIHVMSDFNVWDTVKDIPQWLGGTLFVYVLLALIAGPSLTSGRAWIFYAVFAAVVGGCGYASLKRTPISYYTRAVTYKDYVAFSDPAMAEAANLSWQKLRDRVVWIDPTLPISQQFFYAFQMYNVHPSVYASAKMRAMIAGKGVELGFLVNNRELPAIREAAEARDASIEYLASLESQDASIILVRMDGRRNGTLPAAISQATITTGHYDREIIAGHAFYWMRANANIAVAPTKKAECLSVSVFDSGLTKHQVVTLTTAHGERTSVDLTAHTADSPALLKKTIAIGEDTTQLTISATESGGGFANDIRKVAYGMLLPISLQEGACE